MRKTLSVKFLSVSRGLCRPSKHFLLPWEHITSVAEISFPWFWGSYDLIDKMSLNSSSRYSVFVFTTKFFSCGEKMKEFHTDGIADPQGRYLIQDSYRQSDSLGDMLLRAV